MEASNYGFPDNDESRQNISSEKGSRSFYGRATERGGTYGEVFLKIKDGIVIT